jgi:hypothetical protein
VDRLGRHSGQHQARFEWGLAARKIGARIEREVVEGTKDLPAPRWREDHFDGGLDFGFDSATGSPKVLENGNEVLGKPTRKLALARRHKNGQKRSLAEAEDETRVADTQEIGVPVAEAAGRTRRLADEAKPKPLREALGASKYDHLPTFARAA